MLEKIDWKSTEKQVRDLGLKVTFGELCLNKSVPVIKENNLVFVN